MDATTTTQEVVTRIIQPQTMEQKCRFIDIVPTQHVGPPDFFISHGWGQPFIEQCHKIKIYVDMVGLPLDKVFVWLDIFCVNQHPGTEQQADLGRLKDAICTCPRGTLLLLDSNGHALTRIWILYEIWKTCALRSPSDLLVVATDTNVDSIEDIWLHMDVSKAQATVDSDRTRILSDIQESIGLKELGIFIKDAILRSVRAEADGWPDDDKTSWNYGQVLNKCGLILGLQGMQKESTEYFGKAAMLLGARVVKDMGDGSNEMSRVFEQLGLANGFEGLKMNELPPEFLEMMAEQKARKGRKKKAAKTSFW